MLRIEGGGGSGAEQGRTNRQGQTGAEGRASRADGRARLSSEDSNRLGWEVTG